MDEPLNINDKAFIKLINQGDLRAFEVLFNLYRNKLLFIASQYISNTEDAEDIIQNVFIKVWKKRDVKTNLNAYLYKITKNACLDYLRAKKRKLSIDDNLTQLKAAINYTALSDDASTPIIEEELRPLILDSIDLLPKRCKDVFIKSRVEGLKHKEISNILNISTNTIENHLTKAVKHMRFYLKNHLPFL